MPLISLHIPKCAGTSFRDVLQTWYGDNLRLHYVDEKRARAPQRHRIFEGLLRMRFKPGLCIHGHFNRLRGYGAVEYYPSVNQFITIVRDPFEVHLSNYFHVRNRAERAYRDGSPHKIIAEGFDLEQFLSEQMQSHLEVFFPSPLSLDNYVEILERDFVFIGVAEDLECSVEHLAQKLGFPPTTVPVKNTSPRSEEVPTYAREAFREANPLAYAIYDYARENYLK